MKFVEPSPLTDPDAAARKLVQIANAVEAVQDSRIFIELINAPFLKEGGTPDQFRAALARAITLGWLLRHDSGTYVKYARRGRAVRLRVSSSAVRSQRRSFLACIAALELGGRISCLRRWA
jgi:hypothetical protein